MENSETKKIRKKHVGLVVLFVFLAFLTYILIEIISHPTDARNAWNEGRNRALQERIVND